MFYARRTAKIEYFPCVEDNGLAVEIKTTKISF
jgi:hypothetical protein